MSWDIVAVAYSRESVRQSRVYQSWRTHGRPDLDVELTFYFWFVRSADEVILIDTGYEADWFTRRGGKATWVVPPGELMTSLGIEPSTVRTVVLTHLHFDHIGNLALFPNAELFIQRDEYEFWTGPNAVSPPVEAMTDTDAMATLRAAERDGRIQLLEGDFELRPGLSLRRLPGHTPGQQGVLVDGAVLLASDAAHFYEEYEDDLLFATYTDLPAQLAGYRELRARAAAGCTIVPGHDPAVLTRFPPIDSTQPGLAVRLRRLTETPAATPADWPVK